VARIIGSVVGGEAAGGLAPGSARRRAVGVVVVLLVATLSVYAAARAGGAGPTRCERFTAASAARADAVTGSGRRVVVIGDSYSAGLGLTDLAGSWPTRLPGEVHVAGFSGSGFSAHASLCGRVSFADRASAAVRGGADPVVVEGGLNDFDQPPAAIRAGFRRLMVELEGHPVVVVGPVAAPSRASAVPRVDGLLASLARKYDVAYVRTSHLDLRYLSDQLHLTPAGHAALGDFVAAALH
jgi:acyl-CoA thioesterase I